MNRTTADGHQPLAPLSPDLVSHLTSRLGPPKGYAIGRDGALDIQTLAWCLGRGSISHPGPGGGHRGTDVEILLTESGRFVTTRTQWRKGPAGDGHDSSTGDVHESPAQVLQWLLADGKGKLGPASKPAWVEACRNLPPMRALEFEQIDQTRRLSDTLVDPRLMAIAGRLGELRDRLTDPADQRVLQDAEDAMIHLLPERCPYCNRAI